MIEPDILEIRLAALAAAQDAAHLGGLDKERFRNVERAKRDLCDEITACGVPLRVAQQLVDAFMRDRYAGLPTISAEDDIVDAREAAVRATTHTVHAGGYWLQVGGATADVYCPHARVVDRVNKYDYAEPARSGTVSDADLLEWLDENAAVLADYCAAHTQRSRR